MLVIFAIGCTKPQTPANSDLTEISALYSSPISKMIYSSSVADSFKIFSSLPQNYLSDTTKYPLVILLDGNAYFEPVLAEFELGTLTQGYPSCVIVGVGYKDFATLDSLRGRDYTFPVAAPKDSFAISGGGERFKQFVDAELIPQLSKEFRIDKNNVTLAGHSLGGYFVLYHFFESTKQKKFSVKNYIAASPSLTYYDFYLNDRLKELSQQSSTIPVKLYTSMGTLEYDPVPAPNQFLIFKNGLDSLSTRTGTRIKADEYSNFNHMEAAIPGFMKGLVFALVEE